MKIIQITKFFKFARPYKIYILPSKLGISFLLLIGLFFIVSILYNNNLIYFITFFLFGLFFISLVLTHFNLKGVIIPNCHFKSNFLNQMGQANLKYYCKTSPIRPNIQVYIEVPWSKKKVQLTQSRPLTAVKNQIQSSHLFWPLKKRGYHKIGRIKICTRYPFGFYQSWAWIPVQGHYYVYPMPYNFIKTEIPKVAMKQKQKNVKYTFGDDFYGHKKYQNQDSYRHIDWKAFSRRKILNVKVFKGGEDELYEISYEKLPKSLNKEQKLSQMAFWLIDCQQKGKKYYFELPGIYIEHSDNPQQFEQCLKELAKF